MQLLSNNIHLSKKKDESNNSVQLLLSVKKDSKYENDYTKIDFRVNKDTYMPEQIIAYSSQGDIHDIQFIDFQINKKFKKAVFTIETPSDFRKNTEYLEEKSEQKGN